MTTKRQQKRESLGDGTVLFSGCGAGYMNLHKSQNFIEHFKAIEYIEKLVKLQKRSSVNSVVPKSLCWFL